MKRAFQALAFCTGIFLVTGTIFRLTHPHNTDFLLARSVNLSPEWTQITSPQTMRTTGDFSEVYVELLDVHEDSDRRYILADGTRPSIDGYLVSKSGKTLDFDDGSIVGISPKTYVRLSNRALEWKHDDYRFDSIFLRSDRPLKVGRIVWSSYDPQSTKSGLRTPDSLRDD